MPKAKENNTVFRDKAIIRTRLRYDKDIRMIRQEIYNDYD